MIDLDVHYATHKPSSSISKFSFCTVPAILGQITDLKHSQSDSAKVLARKKTANRVELKQRPDRLEPETFPRPKLSTKGNMKKQNQSRRRRLRVLGPNLGAISGPCPTAASK